MHLAHHNTGKDIEKPYVRSMRLCCGALFKSKVNAEVHWDRWDVVALGLALFAVIGSSCLNLRHSTLLAIRLTSSCMFSLLEVGLKVAACSRTTAVAITLRCTPTFCFCRSGS